MFADAELLNQPLSNNPALRNTVGVCDGSSSISN